MEKCILNEIFKKWICELNGFAIYHIIIIFTVTLDSLIFILLVARQKIQTTTVPEVIDFGTGRKIRGFQKFLELQHTDGNKISHTLLVKHSINCLAVRGV